MDQANNQTTTTENTKTPLSIEPEQLLKALYWVWDVFDRVNFPYFLVNQTYHDAKAQKDLSGDKVEVGVRRMEWISGGRRILDAFAGPPVKEEKNYAIYKHEEVPVIIHVFDDSEAVLSLDTIYYRYEQFKVPNPYEKFLEAQK